jgi:hypothetical protein
MLESFLLRSPEIATRPPGFQQLSKGIRKQESIGPISPTFQVDKCTYTRRFISKEFLYVARTHVWAIGCCVENRCDAS